jgi:cold shock CspA family protein
MAVVTGRVVSFDEVRGYGFVAPESGGEDVFLHVNDLEFDKHLVAPGVEVQFDVERGSRGLKASRVKMREGAERPAAPVAAVARHPGPADDVMSDLLGLGEFRAEVTEVILRVAPSVTGAQICAIREGLEAVAIAHGWVERKDDQG